jgi:hypothetical protein
VSAVSAAAVSRRAFVLGLGVGTGLAVSACSSRAAPGSLAASAYTGDFRTMALAAALENQAVSAYLALSATGRDARRGRDSGGPGGWGPAFARLADACARQHAEHAATWNAILRAAHKPAVAGIPLADRFSLTDAARSATSLGDAIPIALRIEVQAAETYMVAVGRLSSPAGVAAAASIAPVEAMHAAILRFMASEYPVPASFLGTANAARTSELML